MDIGENVRRIFKEMVLPELGKIQEENHKILAILELTNKRLDDVNTHLADQSRRIDDTNKRIDETNKRIDETNKRIDDVRTELIIRMDKMHSDLVHRIDANNTRIDEFFNTAATKEAQAAMDRRIIFLERDVAEVKQRMAA